MYKVRTKTNKWIKESCKKFIKGKKKFSILICPVKSSRLVMRYTFNSLEDRMYKGYIYVKPIMFKRGILMMHKTRVGMEKAENLGCMLFAIPLGLVIGFVSFVSIWCIKQVMFLIYITM